MKERLTGAIILVVLIVLLVPELLSGPKGPSASAPAGAAANPSEEPPLRSYTINLGDDSHSRAGAGSNGSAMPQPNGPAMPQPNGTPTPQPNGTPTPQPSGAPTAPQASAPTAAVSTTGQSNNPAPAQPQRPTHISAPANHPQSRTASTSAASTSATRAAETGGSKAANAPAKPTRAAPASPKSESGWAVQLGVFASRENAERLALDVRVKGFKVSVSPVTSGSRKLYKVRVGPAPDRSAAEELQSRLKAAGRPGGTVVPYS